MTCCNIKDYFIDAYGGIRIQTIRGIHEFLFNALKDLSPTEDSSFLDLGAGEGAFSLRLLDNGFKNVDAVEIEEGKFNLEGVNCF